MTCGIKQQLSHDLINQHQSLTGTLAIFTPINWLQSFKVDLTWFWQNHTIQSHSCHLIISTDHQASILLCCLRSIATPLRSPSFLLSYSSLTTLLWSDSFYLKILWFYIGPFSFSLFYWFYHFPFWSPLKFSFFLSAFGLLVYITYVLHPMKHIEAFCPITQSSNSGKVLISSSFILYHFYKHFKSSYQ